MSTVTCECCWITAVELSLRNDVKLCPPCRGHIWDIGSLRADHRKLTEALIATHKGALAGVKAKIENIDAQLTRVRAERDQLLKTLGSDLANASDIDLKAIEAQAVLALQDDLRRAYFSRNRAMNAVWLLDERHHEGAGDKCSCGKPIHACKDFSDLGFFRDDFRRWERKQIEQMKAGKAHGLPENHPEAIKLNRPAHEWRGLRTTVIEGKRDRVR